MFLIKACRAVEQYLVDQKKTIKDTPLNNKTKFIEKCVGSKCENICIFGMGVNGLKIYEELREYLIDIECFSDNDKEKWGYFRRNIYCISPEYLQYNKENMLVIVSVLGWEQTIMEQLSKEGIKYMINGGDALQKLNEFKKIVPVVEKEDFSTDDGYKLISKFNDTIYEICRHYENKITFLHDCGNIMGDKH